MREERTDKHNVTNNSGVDEEGEAEERKEKRSAAQTVSKSGSAAQKGGQNALKCKELISERL